MDKWIVNLYISYFKWDMVVYVIDYEADIESKQLILIVPSGVLCGQ